MIKRKNKRIVTQLPAGGVAIGETAIREAVQRSFSEVEQILDAELRKVFKVAGEDDPWVWVVALYSDTFVAKRDGKFYRYPYTVTGEAVTIGTPTEVAQTWTPVGGMIEALHASDPELAGQVVQIVEAGDQETPPAFEIRVIRSGRSGNGNVYPAAVLREALPLFEGVRVIAKSDDEHLRGQGKDARNVIGRLVEARFVEGATPNDGEIRARLELLSSAATIAANLREAVERKMSGLFGFSIDAKASVRVKRQGGVALREATRFLKVSSVDLVVEPGAGGEVIQLLEAADPKKDSIMDRETIIQLLEAAGKVTAAEAEKLSDDELVARLTEAVAPADEGGPGTQQPLDPAQITADAVSAAERAIEMREAVAASTLPPKAKDRIAKRVKAAEFETVEEVREAIREEADYVTELNRSGRPAGLGNGGTGRSEIFAGETRGERVQQMLEAFFDPSHKDHRQAQSFRRIYTDITGDDRITGSLQHCDRARLREALAIGDFREAYDSTTLANVLGDSITRRMQAMYANQSVYDVYRRVCKIVPVQDFRIQERTQVGGYGDVPIVAENGDYLPMTTPGDVKATYKVDKRGGTESVTLEMIRNDDVSYISRIPQKLSDAAKRTLSKFVLDFIAGNPVIFDGVTLFHASHGNLGSAALSEESLNDARLRMKGQTEPGSGEKLSTPARSLLVPDALEKPASDLFRRNTENDKTFIQSLTLDVLPVWYWTDPNDWALVADPQMIPMIELGFLDGAEEPELFVQDNPTVGSMFSNDQMKWKLRHIYGATVEDWRGFDKSVVI